MYFIGTDLGTSAVKLVLMEETGKIVRIVSEDYPLSFPHPGWSEQNPEDWYEKTIKGLQKLLDGLDRTQVRGMSFGGQMHGLVMLDEKDRVIRPAILWNDGRSTEEVKYLNETIGKEKLLAWTGNIAYAGFTAPKILWVKKKEPENFRKVKKIMLPKDYLAYRLTGTFSTDYSDASGMLLLDVKNRCWSKEMMDLCEVKEEQLPHLYESYEAIGTLKPEICDELGLNQDVIVAAGAGDNAAAAVGTGTVGEGRCNLSLGTSGTLFISSEQFLGDPSARLHAFAHADGHYHLMGCMLSAASCNKWWMEEILKTDEFAQEQKDIEANLGKNHIYYLPYLMGERSPWNDPHARSAFIGMSMDSTRKDMTQAMLEGVAFGVRDMLEAAREDGISPQRTMICGGGAKSPLWRKIMSNVLNMDIDVPECEEGPGMGGAMLAMAAAGVYRSVKEAADAIVRVKETIHPEPAFVKAYDEKYQNFRMLYPALKPFFQKGE
jgi:xylulokinase